jgi:(p)ppGpp synthase/HD superfamily hydrolase
MSNLVKRAAIFAKRAHAAIDHRRKYTNEPYFVHPAEVAALVRSVPHTDEMLAAAYLHDTVEDTKVTLEDIRAEFGDEVASLVEMLTDVSKPEDGNREVRKAIDREHTAKASPAAKTVKLADLINNTIDIVEHDIDFAVTYLKEKQLLLEVLKEGDPTLWKLAHGLAYQKLP